MKTEDILMKGVVFTEFLEMVEDKFGMDMADEIIDMSDLPSGGVYTSVGTYDHSEIVALVISLSKKTEIEVPDLLAVFGKHLFGRFTQGYPHFFEAEQTAFEFLESIDQYIHVEVKKLYPDAQLPKFDTQRIDENTLQMDYSSGRHFEDLAGGLIEGCMEYFKEPATISREEMGEVVRFEISKNAAER